MKPFAHFSIVSRLYTVLYHRRIESANFLVFYASGGISSRTVAFLFLTFSTLSSLSSVNCPSLMSSGLLIFFREVYQ